MQLNWASGSSRRQQGLCCADYLVGLERRPTSSMLCFRRGGPAHHRPKVQPNCTMPRLQQIWHHSSTMLEFLQSGKKGMWSFFSDCHKWTLLPGGLGGQRRGAPPKNHFSPWEITGFVFKAELLHKSFSYVSYWIGLTNLRCSALRNTSQMSKWRVLQGVGVMRGKKVGLTEVREECQRRCEVDCGAASLRLQPDRWHSLARALAADHGRLEVGVAAGVFDKVVAAHEAFVAQRALKALLASVSAEVAGQLIGSGKFLLTADPGTGKWPLACKTKGDETLWVGDMTKVFYYDAFCSKTWNWSMFFTHCLFKLLKLGRCCRCIKRDWEEAFILRP